MKEKIIKIKFCIHDSTIIHNEENYFISIPREYKQTKPEDVEEKKKYVQKRKKINKEK